VGQELLAYIIKEEQAGFSEEQIRKALKKAGYSPQQIVEAFRALDGSHDATVHGYVQEYARSGKSAEETFQHLHEQGYDPGDIHHSIHNVYGHTSSRPHTAIFVILALIVGAGVTYLFLADFTQGEQAIPTYSPTEKIALALEDAQNGRDGLRSCDEELTGAYLEKCYAVIAAATSDSSICGRIYSDDVHDSCWMSFIDTQFDVACTNVRLAENKETCSSLRVLQA